MSTPFEDGPPCVPAREYSSFRQHGSAVLDHVDAMCMAARQARAKLAMRLIPACHCGSPAVVNGLCREHDEEAFYAKVRTLPAEEQFE